MLLRHAPALPHIQYKYAQTGQVSRNVWLAENIDMSFLKSWTVLYSDMYVNIAPGKEVEHWVYSALAFIEGFIAFWLIFHWIGIVKWELSRGAGVVIGHWSNCCCCWSKLNSPLVGLHFPSSAVCVCTHIPQTLSANDDAVGQTFHGLRGHNIGRASSQIMRIRSTNDVQVHNLSKQVPTGSYSHFPGAREEFPSLVCRGCSGVCGGGGVSEAYRWHVKS